MECFVAPFNASAAQLIEALMNTLWELGLSAQIDHWQLARLKVSAAPHIDVYHMGNPAAVAAALKSPYFKLAPEDIAVLESDPAVRQRYTELVVETWLPQLRVMVELFTTQVRWLTCHVHVLVYKIHNVVDACANDHAWALTDAPERRRRARAAGGAVAQSIGRHLGRRPRVAHHPFLAGMHLRSAARVPCHPLAEWRPQSAPAGGGVPIYGIYHDHGRAEEGSGA
jgi:hypothetical protein